MIKPQLVKDVEYSKLTFPLIAQRKWNGVRALLWIHPDGTKSFQTRALKPILSCEHIINSCSSNALVPSFCIDGELVINYDVDDFNKSSGLVRRHYNSPEVIFKTFDTYNFEQEYLIYMLRLKSLTKLIDDISSPYISQVESFIVTNRELLDELTTRAYNNGWEGLVLKNPNSVYSPGKRNWDWQRIIFRKKLLCFVKSILEGKGKYVNSMGRILCSCNGKEFYLGTGFSDEERKEIWNKQSLFIGRLAQFSYKDQSDTSFIQPAFEGWV